MFTKAMFENNNNKKLFQRGREGEVRKGDKGKRKKKEPHNKNKDKGRNQEMEAFPRTKVHDFTIMTAVSFSTCNFLPN